MKTLGAAVVRASRPMWLGHSLAPLRASSACGRALSWFGRSCNMLVLAVLIVALLVFRTLGFVGVSALASWHASARDALAVMLFFTGSGHFTPMRRDFIRMTPPWVPWPSATVYFTGICEIAGAVGMLLPGLYRAAGICLIIFFLPFCRQISTRPGPASPSAEDPPLGCW
jgi:hypothetical protein